MLIRIAFVATTDWRILYAIAKNVASPARSSVKKYDPFLSLRYGEISNCYLSLHVTLHDRSHRVESIAR